MNTTFNLNKKRGGPTFLANPKTGENEFAILPMAEYQALVDAAEMAEDVAAFDAAENDELFPAEVVDRLLEGENPVRVYREHRKMTQGHLAEAAELHQTTISQIETGERTGTVDVLSRLAKALGVDLEDLIPRAED